MIEFSPYRLETGLTEELPAVKDFYNFHWVMRLFLLLSEWTALDISMISFKTMWGMFYLCCLGFIDAVLLNIAIKTSDETSETVESSHLCFIKCSRCSI